MNTITDIHFYDDGVMFRYRWGTVYIRFYPELLAKRVNLIQGRMSYFRPQINLLENQITLRISRKNDCENFSVNNETIPVQMLIRFLKEPYKMEWKHQLATIGFFDMIPNSVKSVIKKFPNRLWHMLSLVGRSPNESMALDLAESDHALFYALGSGFCFYEVKQHMRKAKNLLGKRSIKIVDALGFNPTQATINHLRKLPVKILSIPNLLALRELSHDSGAKKNLCHIKRISPSVLRILNDVNVRKLVTQAFLEEISIEEEEYTYPEIYFQLKQLVNDILETKSTYVPKIQSINRLEKLIYEFNEKVHLHRIIESNIRFPPPPLESKVSYIRPLSLLEVTRVGRRYKNCASNMEYIENIAEGHIYMYEYRRDNERALFTITRTNEIGKNLFTVLEIEGVQRAKISRQGMMDVGMFLLESQNVGNIFERVKYLINHYEDYK